MPNSRDCRNRCISQKLCKETTYVLSHSIDSVAKNTFLNTFLTKQSHPTVPEHNMKQFLTKPNNATLTFPHASFIQLHNKIVAVSLGYLPHLTDCWKGPALYKILYRLWKIIMNPRKGLRSQFGILILKTSLLTIGTDVNASLARNWLWGHLLRIYLWIMKSFILCCGRILLRIKWQQPNLS